MMHATATVHAIGTQAVAFATSAKVEIQDVVCDKFLHISKHMNFASYDKAACVSSIF